MSARPTNNNIYLPNNTCTCLLADVKRVPALTRRTTVPKPIVAKLRLPGRAAPRRFGLSHRTLRSACIRRRCRAALPVLDRHRVASSALTVCFVTSSANRVAATGVRRALRSGAKGHVAAHVPVELVVYVVGCPPPPPPPPSGDRPSAPPPSPGAVAHRQPSRSVGCRDTG